jgi:hypothetical protein
VGSRCCGSGDDSLVTGGGGSLPVCVGVSPGSAAGPVSELWGPGLCLCSRSVGPEEMPRLQEWGFLWV